MSAKNGLERSGTVTRSLPDLSVLRFFAVALGTYPSNSIAFITRRRVLAETTFGWLRTRDTVAVETPARLATSKIFGFERSAIRRHDNTVTGLFSSRLVIVSECRSDVRETPASAAI